MAADAQVLRDRAEARRRRILAGDRQRLARISGGNTNASDVGSDGASGNTPVATRAPAVPDPALELVTEAEGPSHTSAYIATAAVLTELPTSAGEGAATAWARSLQIRRWERGYRFFGNALLATVLGLLKCDDELPPLMVFVVCEIGVLILAASTLARQSEKQDAGHGQEGESESDPLAVALGALGLGATTWAKFDNAALLFARFVAALQDVVWFIVVLLSGRQARQVVLHICGSSGTTAAGAVVSGSSEVESLVSTLGQRA